MHVTTLLVFRHGAKMIVDIVIAFSDSHGIDALKSSLQEKFRTKDLCKLRSFLGIKVTRCQKGICFSQRKYVLNLPEEVGLLGAESRDTL